MRDKMKYQHLRTIIAALCITTSNLGLANAQASSNASTAQPPPLPPPNGSVPIAGLPVTGRQQPPQPAQQPQQPVGPSQPQTTGTTFGAYSPEALCAQGPDLMQGYPLYQQQQGGIFGFGQSNANANPCTVTCQNQQAAWMIAKPHGAPCRHPNDPQGERYCLNQNCVVYNASLNEYCREALNLNVNSPDYMALMPYGCTVACLDKSTPSVVQVQFTNGMTCHVNIPGGRKANGYCVNGACSTFTYRGPGGGRFLDNLLDPRIGVGPGAAAGQNGPGYPYQGGPGYPYQGGLGYPGYGGGGPLGFLSGLFGRRRR